MRWSVVVACIAICACIIERGNEGRNEAVISVICKCTESPLPKAQEMCVEKLKAEFEQNQGDIPQACATCVLANQDRCASLEQQCEQACSNPIPPTGDDDVPQPGGPK